LNTIVYLICNNIKFSTLYKQLFLELFGLAICIRTLQMFCALTDQGLTFHWAFRSLSTQALRTMRVGAVKGNLMRYLVRCRLFNLYSWRGTPVRGPSTKTCK